jgi:NADH-quinone oxidoreductase subunit E
MLSPQITAKIDRELAKYPANQRRSAVMSALAIAQDEHGWLSKEIISDVAVYLGIPDIAVLEVASFYNMYEMKPVGKYKLTVCTNISCMLRDANGIVEHLEHRLGIHCGETTEDGKFTLKEGECMGACGSAPLLLVNNKDMREFLTNERVDEMLESLK